MVAEDLVLTVAEVNDRLPLVRSIVRDIVELHQDITGRRERFRSVRRRHSGSQADDESVYEQEMRQLEDELAHDENRLDEYATELQKIGGIVTDPVTGIVDFPALLGGDRVWLCWQMGEPEVRFWHAGECGESERLPLEQDEVQNGCSSIGGGHSQTQE